MMEEVEIENFKGIKKSKISDLKQINLFIGRNNVGKSSIIEAIHSTCREYRGGELQSTLSRRTDRNTSPRELWFRYNKNSVISVRMKFNVGLTLGMRVQLGPERQTFVSHLFCTAPVDWEKESSSYSQSNFGFITITTRMAAPPIKDEAELRKYLHSTLLIDDSLRTKMNTIEAEFLNEIVLSNQDPELSTRHSDIYGKDTNVQFVPHPDFPNQRSRFTLSEYRKRIFLDDFGDGPKYGLAIYSAAMTLKNTALFVEEIENHQHPGAIRKLIKHLIEIAKKNELQLFVTTHSFEAFRQFYYHYKKPEDREKEFQCFHISRDAKTGIVEAKPEDNFQRIMEDIFEIER